MTEHERHQMRMEDLQREQTETVKNIRDIAAREEERQSGGVGSALGLFELVKLFPKLSTTVIIFLALLAFFLITGDALFSIYATIIRTLYLPIEPTWLNFRITLVVLTSLGAMLLAVLVVRVLSKKAGAFAWSVGGIAGVFAGGICAAVVFVTEIPWGKIISSAFFIAEAIVIAIFVVGALVFAVAFVIEVFKKDPKEQRKRTRVIYVPDEEEIRQQMEALNQLDE